jgi:cytochrome d ubiquinol oxidase subunit I
MGIYLVIVEGMFEGMWLKNRNPDYYHHARFWSKLYVLNFGIGVASGIPMEFQIGTNWTPFSEAVGDFFGRILGFEASMAFMLEAGFLGIMLFDWERVNPIAIVHYFATIMVAFRANLSTVWILVANSWLQTPAGGEIVNGKFIVSENFVYLDNSNFLAQFYRLGVDCFPLHYFLANHDLPSRSFAQRPGIYDCVYGHSAPDYDILQHLQLCCVSG